MGYPAYDITNTSKRAKTYMNMHDAGSENDVVLNTYVLQINLLNL